MPSFDNLSIFGVGIGPPLYETSPQPRSSVKIITTLGFSIENIFIENKQIKINLFIKTLLLLIN